MEIKRVGVVGGGIMGSGIAQACARSGYGVVMSEVNDDLLNKGLASISGILSGSVERDKLSPQDRDAIIGRIKGTTDINEFSGCDLIIEAVTEDMELKKSIFARLDKVCPPHVILTTNTSVLSVIDIAAATKRKDRVVGTHFFYPAPVNKLLEVVKTVASSDETVEVVKDFGESLGKTVVIAKDTPGFIVNRLELPFVLNAIRMLEAGIATREDIDNAVKLGLNHPIGPLALVDMLGIDTLCLVSDAMYEELKDPQFILPPLARKIAAAGWYGRKSGRGIYEYDMTPPSA